MLFVKYIQFFLRDIAPIENFFRGSILNLNQINPDNELFIIKIFEGEF